MWQWRKLGKESSKELPAQSSQPSELKEKPSEAVEAAAPSSSVAEENEWRETRPEVIAMGFTGTACKCKAHVSLPWTRGGEEWLLRHVADVHQKDFDWREAVHHALTLSPSECQDFLRDLVG